MVLKSCCRVGIHAKWRETKSSKFRITPNIFEEGESDLIIT